MMTKENFEAYLVQSVERIEKIRESAYELHRSVNQTYGDGLPYGYHLDMVANAVREFGYLVCADEDDIIPMLFAAYYHDSIEDARQTYNDVMNRARTMMTESQARMATEIVYALTNDKGRTRAERAGERYYQGIRETPYAPFVKLADRRANITYSCKGQGEANAHMREVYKNELPHFLEAINAPSSDIRFSLPDVVIKEIMSVIETPQQ